jgi:hypothetical protein
MYLCFAHIHACVGTDTLADSKLCIVFDDTVHAMACSMSGKEKGRLDKIDCILESAANAVPSTTSTTINPFMSVYNFSISSNKQTGVLDSFRLAATFTAIAPPILWPAIIIGDASFSPPYISKSRAIVSSLSVSAERFDSSEVSESPCPRKSYAITLLRCWINLQTISSQYLRVSLFISEAAIAHESAECPPPCKSTSTGVAAGAVATDFGPPPS